jgi:hypothetical protein
MRPGTGSRAWHHAWLAGRIAALLAILVGGTLAIVHYARADQTLASGPGQPTVTVSHTVRAAVTHSSRRTRRSQAAQAAAATPPANTPARSPSPSAAPASSSPRPSQSTMTTPPPPSSGHGRNSVPIHFRTLPPGAVLPTGAECARWVRQSPRPPENKGVNKRFNHVTGQHVGPHFFPAGDSPHAQRKLAPRINGHFTGTTKQILRWAACKWGINQNVVFAQAAVESWWRQTTLGDWGTDPKACPPGHKLGADGQAGQCPQSYGILQNRYPFEKGSWPGIGRSTAMNADTAYAIWRSCYVGDEIWLNNVPHNGRYHRGDMWGCVGRWFAGRWHTAPAQQYIKKVRTYLRERIWTTKDFQQP